jgi:DNA-binding NarL/FixJ family response regulator
VIAKQKLAICRATTTGRRVFRILGEEAPNLGVLQILSNVSCKRVVLAEDHLEMANRIFSILSTDFDVVAMVQNGEELVRAVYRHAPDVVVSDVYMPIRNGLEAMKELRADGLRVPFVLVSSAFEGLTNCAKWGAAACVSKNNLATELNHAVRLAAQRS